MPRKDFLRGVFSYLIFFTIGAESMPIGLNIYSIEKILIKMESSVTSNFTLKDYADELFLSVDHFSHLFTETVGIPPHRYMLMLKMTRAKQLLIQTDHSISQIAKFIGYGDPLYFSRIFKKHCNLTPMQYRKSAKNHTPQQIPLSFREHENTYN